MAIGLLKIETNSAEIMNCNLIDLTRHDKLLRSILNMVLFY